MDSLTFQMTTCQQTKYTLIISLFFGEYMSKIVRQLSESDGRAWKQLSVHRILQFSTAGLY